MRLDGVLFLAGYTARSKAYAQALARNSLEPAHVLLFGNPEKGNGQGTINDRIEPIDSDLVFPDLAESLDRTCGRAGWAVERCQQNDINGPEIPKLLRKISPDLVIYAGYGGQIVRPPILAEGFPFLHLHSGWLPDYRGSTTIYYSWLEQQSCAVTALILDEGIDTGPIVAQRRYPLPPPGLEVDKMYDSAIRANLLVEVMRNYAKRGGLGDLQTQSGEGRTYYVIHPVLKHLVLLSRESRVASTTIS